MEPTMNPPPYQREDFDRTANNFNNLQQYAWHSQDMIIYRSDYQIFDNSWRVWNLLERTKRQLSLNIARMQVTMTSMEQEQTFLLQKANHHFHILNTSEVQWRANAPPTENQFQHPNTPELRPQWMSPSPFAPVEEIFPPIVNISKQNGTLF